MALISLAVAKAHLHIAASDTTRDLDVALKLAQAEAIILDRCNTTAHHRAVTATWTELTLPLAVQAAILNKLTGLYEHRGDDMRLDEAEWQSIERLLVTHKDPVIA